MPWPLAQGELSLHLVLLLGFVFVFVVAGELFGCFIWLFVCLLWLNGVNVKNTFEMKTEN